MNSGPDGMQVESAEYAPSQDAARTIDSSSPISLELLALILNHSVTDEDKSVRLVCKRFDAGYNLALAYHQDREIEYLLKNQASILENEDENKRAQMEAYFSALKDLVGGNKKDIPHVQHRERILDQLNGAIMIAKIELALLNPQYLQLACASCHLTRVPSYLFSIPKFLDFWKGVRNIDLSHNHLTRLPLALEVLQNNGIVNIFRLEGNRLALCPRAHDLMDKQSLYISQPMDWEDGCESPDNSRKKHQRIF